MSVYQPTVRQTSTSHARKTRMRARILGGGVAGLAAAVALRRQGLDDVLVLERDTPAEMAARAGHGMMLMPNAVAALHALGADGCLDGQRALREAVFQDERGRVLRRESLEGTYCVTRRGLIDGLRAELPAGLVQHGRRCSRVVLDSVPADSSASMTTRVRAVGFAAGPSLRATDCDLFVAADGPQSQLCAALNPTLARPRSRVSEIVMSAWLPELAERIGTTFLKTVVPQRGLAFGLLSPCRGVVIGFLQFDVRRHHVSREAAPAGLRDFAVAVLGDVPEPVACFLRDVDPSTAHLWRPYDSDVAPRLCASNAVLIGDAAHPLLPFCSQGVGAALEDALLLGEAMADRDVGVESPARALAQLCEARRVGVLPYVEGGRRILSSFVGASAGFVAPYVHAVAPPRHDEPEDALFSDDRVDVPVLRSRAYNHRWAVQRAGVIPLTAADPDFPACAQIIAAVQRHLACGYVSYGPPEGLPELRGAAACALGERHALPCTPDTLLPTDGAASAVFLAARFALARPGDEAIVPDPVDFLLERSVLAAGGVVRRWTTAGGVYDVARLEALVTPRTRLISLCNPHNPLGRVLRRDELEAIADVALRHDLWILSDEVWSDIVYAPHAHVSMASLGADVAARTLTVFGFSKSHGLAGMRLGLLAAASPQQRTRLMALAHAGDTAFGASTISQVAGTAALELGDDWRRRFVQHLRRRRDQTVARLDAIPGVRCAVPQGTFVAFPDIARLGVDQDELARRLLDDHDVAVVPGSASFFGPGAAGHLRLSFATSRAILAEGLDRVEAGLLAAAREERAAAA
jgi:aspartate/methionine/tyrosine aminotransferase/2-polyprenyl-6-methoxyphenol hydroxylase-like FAD-dependent oxidoreductase